MIGFYCATPYHVMTAINLMLSKYEGKRAKLYILNHTKDAIALVKRLQKSGLFEDVVFINNSNVTLSMRFKRVWEAFIPNPQIRQIGRNEAYTEFIFFCYDFLNATYLVKQLRKKNSACQFAFGDDGLGSYMEDIYTPNKVVMFLLRLTGRKKYLTLINQLFVFMPELVFANKQLQTSKIPKYQYKNERFRSIVNEIWPLDALLEQPLLYFQQPIYGEQAKRVAAMEKQLFARLSEMSLPFAVKLHPLTYNYDACPAAQLVHSKIPFECFILQQRSDDKVLISYFSTALFTPFMLFDQTPRLVFLYELTDGSDDILPQYRMFLERFINIYPDQANICVPQSLEELVAFLKTR